MSKKKTIRHKARPQSRSLKPESFWIHITYLDEDEKPKIIRLENMTPMIAKLKADACCTPETDVVTLIDGKCKTPHFANGHEILHTVQPRPFVENGVAAKPSSLGKLREQYAGWQRRSIWAEDEAG